ncbi:hypothetical protein NCS57_00326100 [Fusarium keratoplasticum]|uniref:Uncharacterized protein n=1 Tax=Fusarium keratoplasticum TaxID=1328300 RepID=A0ACC0RB06_9HYPO|nr:hypothetical protein NCS57_00326100 [Fusarium keratoplasticum]KAI8680455.1 hypothetical protein NCS57_00326100 [Fusarium keratoplasticum]
MFYSESLLQKSGPLARIWLSANLQRKLSKKHVLQSNLADSIAIMITPSQVPMALRLSSQLLLGAVRIYQRKARYLLDDCDDTWIMMQMTFRPSLDHDLPISLQHPDPEALTIPNEVIPYNGFELAPPPDANWLLSQIGDVGVVPVSPKRRATLRDITLPEILTPSQYTGMYEEAVVPTEGVDLELDFGIEIGREAPAPRPFEEEMVSELEPRPAEKEGPEIEPTFEEGLGELPIGVEEEFEFHPADITAPPIPESPLSEISEEVVQQIEEEIPSLRLSEPRELEEERPLLRRPEQRIRRRRVMAPDEEITLSSRQIQHQQTNHEAITRPTRFYPRDPLLGALIGMQASGGFVSSIMMEGRSVAWAPELRGVLSFDAVQEARQLARKRPAREFEVEVEPEQRVSKSPRLEIAEEPVFEFGEGIAEPSIPGEETMMEIPPFEASPPPPSIPAQRLPIPTTTEHAVYALRDQFVPEAAISSEVRESTSVIFQDFVPEQQATKAEAAKMFFECLVLATKGAIKLEQGPGLGDPIQVWARESLWGDFAETDTGGEMIE